MQVSPFMVHKENFLQDDNEPLVEAKFSPDGKQILTANDNGGLTLWDLDTSDKVCDLVGHEEMVMCLTFSKCGAYAASCSMDNSAIVWSRTDGAVIHKLVGHEDIVNKVVFSNDSK